MESTSEILTIENLLPDELTALEPVSNNDHQQQFNWLANDQSNREPATQPPAADGTLQSGIEATQVQTVYPQAQSSFNQSIVNQGLPVSLHSSTTSFSTFNASNSMNLINRPVQLPNSSLHQFNNFQTYNNRVPTLNQCRYAVPAVNQCTYTVPTSDQSSSSRTQVKPVQQLEDWQLSISEENRNDNVNCLIEAIFSNGCAESMLDDRLNHLLNYAKKVENEIYHAADSEVDYHQLLVDKIISSRIEIEERRRKREILANQRHVIPIGSNTNLPPAPIRIPTIAGVAEVSGNLQPALLNRNQSIDTPLGLPGLDQAAQAIQAAPTQVTKEWHKRLTLDLRKHFIANIIKKLWMRSNGTFLDNGIQHLSR
ncbi:uncharacterized protein LOC141534994 isoform X2 [Cotesia typhae]